MINKKATIKQNSKKDHMICKIIIAFIVIASLTVFIFCKIDNVIGVEQRDVLATSSASYWGAIIGGIISGILSFFGVFYTIRYYKESDEQRQRVSVQPFLLAEFVNDEECQPVLFTYLGEKLPEKEYQTKFLIKITNIGNGYAKLRMLIRDNNKNADVFPVVLKINETIYIDVTISIFDLLHPIEFSIQFIDSMTNEYIQKYIIRSEVALRDIESEYPQLCEK